jgi:hypothetical protein
MDEVNRRMVTLRDIHAGPDRRFLSAYLDGQGNLHLDGHDLGPATASMSPDGEYEWFQVIAAVDVERVVMLLDGQAGENVLDLLARDWTGDRSYELERRLRASDIPIDFSSWSG